MKPNSPDHGFEPIKSNADAGTVWNGLGIGLQGPMTTTFTSGALVKSDGSPMPGVTVTLNNFGVYDNLFDLYPGMAHTMPWPHREPPQIVKIGNL